MEQVLNPPRYQIDTGLPSPWPALHDFPTSGIRAGALCTGEITCIFCKVKPPIPRVILTGYRGTKVVAWAAPVELVENLKKLQPGTEVRVMEDGTLLANGSVDVYKGILATIPVDGVTHLSHINMKVRVQ